MRGECCAWLTIPRAPYVEREALAMRAAGRAGALVGLFLSVIVDGRSGVLVEGVDGEDLRLGRRHRELRLRSAV